MSVAAAAEMETALPARLREHMLATRDHEQVDGDAGKDASPGEGIFKTIIRDLVSGREDNVLQLSDLECRLAVTLEEDDSTDQPPDTLVLATEPDCGLILTLDRVAQSVFLAALTGSTNCGSQQNVDGPLTRELIIALAQSVADAFTKAARITLPSSAVWKVQDTATDKNEGRQNVTLGVSIPQKRSAALLKQDTETVIGILRLHIEPDLMLEQPDAQQSTKPSVQNAVLDSEVDLSIAVPARRMSLLSIGELQVGDVIGLPDDKLSVRASNKDGPVLEGTMVQLDGQHVFCVSDVTAAHNCAEETLR